MRQAISPELQGEIRKWIIRNKIESEDEFVFYLEGRDAPVSKRSNYICSKVNKKINDSKILKKDPSYVYSSHMFRKGVVQAMYKEGMNEFKEKIRKKIGHKKNSTAIKHYINQKFFKKFKIMIK
jgi:hypothetical protein